MKNIRYNIPILDKFIKLVLGTGKFIAFCMAGLVVLFLVLFVIKQRAYQEKYKAPFHDVTVAGETFRLPSKYYPDDGQPEYNDLGSISFKLMTWDIDPNMPIKGKTVGFNLYDQVSVYIKQDAYPNADQYPLKERPIFKGQPISPKEEPSEGRMANKSIQYLGTFRTDSYFFSVENKKYFSCAKNGIMDNPTCRVWFMLMPRIALGIYISRQHINDFPKIIDAIERLVKKSIIHR